MDYGLDAPRPRYQQAGHRTGVTRQHIVQVHGQPLETLHEPPHLTVVESLLALLEISFVRAGNVMGEAENKLLCGKK